MTRYTALGALVALTAAVLSGCAGPEAEQASQDKIRQATIEAIDGIDPAIIAISDITRTPAKISWRVTAGAQIYACDADGGYRLPWCRPES